jgi:nitrous oxidase accessory protein NosD
MLVALAVALLAAGGSGPPRVRVVGPGAAYPSVGAALAAAVPGDTIRVRAGRYRERLTIDRRVVILGEPGAVIDGERRGTLVTITTDSVELRGDQAGPGAGSANRR